MDTCAVTVMVVRSGHGVLTLDLSYAVDVEVLAITPSAGLHPVS